LLSARKLSQIGAGEIIADNSALVKSGCTLDNLNPDHSGGVEVNWQDRCPWGWEMQANTRLGVRVLSLLLVMGLVATGQATAQENSRAANAYAAENWAGAAAGYERLLAEDGENGRYWYRLAVSLRHLEQFGGAGDALAAAARYGVPPSYVEVERARLHLAQGEPQLAIASIAAAVDAGYSADALANDTDLAALRSHSRWEALIAEARRKSEPCNYDPRFREFDFWVGEWEVTTADGAVAGTNRISREELGCTLIERWSGASGGTGTSLNYFDPVSGNWVQHWVGVGVIIDIAGGLRDGSMRLSGHVHYIGNGQTKPFRGTWTALDDGRVRQFFEESQDEGESWQTWFEGFYSRTDKP
jgi:hypothetical protein